MGEDGQWRCTSTWKVKQIIHAATVHALYICTGACYVIFMYMTVCTTFSQTHSGSVWRVTWAHPEYGQVLATCSFDRTVGVWEEQSMCNRRLM